MMSEKKANIMEKSTPKRAFSGDPDENRTRVTAVKGPCLNLLTTGPTLMQKAPEKKKAEAKSALLVAATGLEPVTLRV